ncbi:MAG: LPS export ABC transporter periplasmic protein LptC [Rhizobacter sp.]
MSFPDTQPSTLEPAAVHLSPAPARQPWHWQLLQLASTYLPVMLMALLALGTWWLVKNTVPVTDERPVAAPKHVPDYQMHNFSVQRYTSTGSLEAQIEGGELRHYPDNDTVEIDDVRLRAIDEEGRASVATARQALTNGGATEVQLLGQAQLVREASGQEAAVHFRSEYLHAFLDTERVFTDKPVTVTQGGTEMRADGMEYTHSDGVIRFNGRTRAVFEPRPQKQ